MKPRSKVPWRRSRPAKNRHTKLTVGSKARAKATAKKAGRRYPNLADNMQAAKKQKSRK